MKAFTYSNARQNLSRILDLAAKTGEVCIKRRDGRSFIIRPESKQETASPLDVKGVSISRLAMEDILKSIHDGRKKY